MRALILIVALVLGYCGPAYAQSPTVLTEQIVVGSVDPADAPSASTLIRLISNPVISGASGTLRPLVFDNSGRAWTDNVTGISTAGAYTFGSTIAGSAGTLNVSGALTTSGQIVASSGNIVASAGMFDARGAVDVTDLGADSARLGIRSGAPTLIFNDSGSPSWDVDNNLGVLRFFRRGATGTADDLPQIPLLLDANFIVGPRGKRILPSTPYGVDLGSQQFKFGAIWGGDLFFDTLVTIENIGTIDNRWLIGSGNILDEDLSTSATSMITRYNNYVSGTFVYLQKFARTEFLKTTSGPTLTNIISNGSFESGTTTGWSCSTNCTSVINTTLKSFHGERSMLANVSPAASTLVLFNSALVPSTTYTTCVYARRFDGAAIADGDIEIYHADGFVGVPVQPTGTDNWVRVCRTSVAGNVGGGSQNMHLNTKGVNYFLDATQTEVTSTQRPYSDFRASYTIARNQDGGVANQWYAGDGMFGAGAVAGDGWIDCYAIKGIKSLTENGPACAVNVRTGSNFNDWAPRAAWGNLDGIYGYGATTYGFAAGNSAATWVALDDSNGMRIMNGANVLVQFGPTGNGFLDGSLNVRNSVIVGTFGDIRSGATDFDAGTGYWLDFNAGSPRIRVGTTSAGSDFVRYSAATGLQVKSSNVRIDAGGIAITGYTGGAWQDQTAYRFDYGGGTLNGIAMYGSTVRSMEIRSSQAGPTSIGMISESSIGTDAELLLQSQNGGTASRINLNSQAIRVNGTTAFSGTCSAASFTVQNGIITSC